VSLGLRESNISPDHRAIHPVRLAGNYARALRSPACGGNALVGGLSMGCMFAYVAASPLILLGIYRLSTLVYGALFAITAGAIMAGAWLSGRMAQRGGRPEQPIVWGLVVAAGTSLLLVVVAAFANAPPLLVLMPLLVANTFCLGLLSPNATHAAIEGMGEIAGVATALVGCARMLGAAASSALVGLLFPSLRLLALPVTMAMFACASLAVWWFVARPAGRIGAAA
jgi:DHA1 family bicyclomycin/chloramphenicol resistance-like MFS transporter